MGEVISPVLANLALDGLERLLLTAFPKNYWAQGRTRTNKVNLVRYADDFIITGGSREQLEGEVLPLVKQFMRERGLELSEEKTVITHIAEGFDFLGQNVRKYDGKMLIKPAKRNVKAFLGTVRGLIKDNPTMTAGNLIARLNPVIRGWARYHRHVVSKDVFAAVDNAIFNALWRWARRRHSKMGARWVKAKYFHTVGNRKWVFSGAMGDGQMRRLLRADSIPIRRHAKIQNTANPYDPAWETYFEERQGLKMATNLAGRRTLLYLWKRQGGGCPRCGQPITSITGWHSHHVIWKSKGGSARADNRQLLHPNCHMQVHNPQFSDAKPRPVTGASRKA